MTLPRVIGRYEIIEELGRGAMGSVFKARDPAVGRVVAIKTIHAAALSGDYNQEYRARFQREASASGVLSHPGIVPVFDVGEHEDAPFLVMEFVEGRTLERAMKQGERFTLERASEIGQQLAEALGYAHRQGVIHRDIKPANILLTSREVYGSERPRITDFGIAKLLSSDLTSTGQLLGTPAYMPPEQFTGTAVDGRADIFSLGVILYAMATAEQPFGGETVTAVSYKVVHTDPIPPSKLNPAISASLESVILKCLAKNPTGRYQTGEDLAQDLAALRANPSTTIVRTAVAAAADPNATLAAAPKSILETPAQAPAAAQGSRVAPGKKPSSSRNRQAIAAASLLLIAAAATGGWFLLRQLGSRPAPVAQQQTSAAPASQLAAPAPLPTTQESIPPVSTPNPKTKPTPAKHADAKTMSAVKPVAASQTSAQTASPAPPPATTPSAAAAPKPSAATAAKPDTEAAAAFDPQKLNPTSNTRFKIELNHLPSGLPVTVRMNRAVYLRFVTNGRSSLDNLFVPPGIQTFQVTVKNGSQEVLSNVVSSEFKARKRKNLKIELRNQGNKPASSPSLLSSGAQIFISLSSPLF